MKSYKLYVHDINPIIRAAFENISDVDCQGWANHYGYGEYSVLAMVITTTQCTRTHQELCMVMYLIYRCNR